MICAISKHSVSQRDIKVRLRNHIGRQKLNILTYEGNSRHWVRRNVVIRSIRHNSFDYYKIGLNSQMCEVWLFSPNTTRYGLFWKHLASSMFLLASIKYMLYVNTTEAEKI